MTSIGLIDYKAGNLRSVENALSRLGLNFQRVEHAEQLNNFDRLILPGVGAFEYGMNQLKILNLIEPIKLHVKQGRMLVGICLGMQLLADIGFEGEKPTNGLGLISGSVERISGYDLRLPHVGWNSIRINHDFRDFAAFNEMDFYFVHSYFFNVKNKTKVVGWSEYGIEFASIVKDANVSGCQFHPEKSHGPGLMLFEKLINSHVEA